MEIEAVPFRKLGRDVLDRWIELHGAASAPCDSPFFRPEFSEVIDQVRGDVEVAIVRHGGQITALLPFHRTSGNIGKPVGLQLNDFQGLVAAEGAQVQLRLLLAECRLRAWDFDHVPVEQQAFAESVALTDPSPYIDLSGGYAAYRQWRDESSNDLRDSARRLRKLEREHGPVRVEFDIADQGVVEQLIQWKRAQFTRTGVPDVLEEEWSLATVMAMVDRREPEFAGIVSGMWCGDRLIAAEMALRCHRIYHVQWCAYDPECHRYSPGRLLGEAMLPWCDRSGISRYEFGKGDQEYKLRAATGSHRVATGSVASSVVQRAVRGSWWALRRWARSSRLRGPLKKAANYYFRLCKAAPLLVKEGV